MTKVLEVYAESTPNPAALKFVTGRLLLGEGQVEFQNKQQAAVSPLASQLFDFSGVKSVFISGNFITIVKDSDTDWYELMPIFREFIKSFLQSGEKVFTSHPLNPTPPKEESDQEEPPPVAAGDTAAQIRNILEEYVLPAVEQDGGHIHFVSYDDGVVKVMLQGACSGCPSSIMTLKSGIENLLTRMVPGVKEVVAVEG
jgi:Fe-S cluster biogenesis protein NfuA